VSRVQINERFYALGGLIMANEGTTVDVESARGVEVEVRHTGTFETLEVDPPLGTGAGDGEGFGLFRS
jgi:hypothetical protein